MSNTLRMLPLASVPRADHADASPPRASTELPGLSDNLETQISALAAIRDPRSALLVGQAAIARFGPVPQLLRHTLEAGRQLLEDAEAGIASRPGGHSSATFESLARSVGAYLDVLLDAAVPVAGASPPLFMQVILSLFARQRWARAAALLETSLTSGRPAVPETWVRASLARAYSKSGQREQARAALRSQTRATRTP